MPHSLGRLRASVDFIINIAEFDFRYTQEVSAVLADAEAAGRLVKALQANKALLPEKKPNDEAAN